MIDGAMLALLLLKMLQLGIPHRISNDLLIWLLLHRMGLPLLILARQFCCD